MTTKRLRQKKKLKGKWKAFLGTRFGRFLKQYIGWDDGLAIVLVFIGALFYGKNGFLPYNEAWHQFYKEIHAELIGIGITVLIISNANQALKIKSEKRRLILQMGSLDKGFAIEAARQLQQRGWLFDGTTKRAFLRWANLEGALLKGAHLEGVDLVSANLRNTYLYGANLEGAYLRLANLTEANMEHAYLKWVKLDGANLLGANLERAYLMQAHFEGTSLREAKLKGAFLKGAHLEGADLWGAVYDENTEWKWATYNNKTIWPDESFDPKAKGLINIDKTGEQPME